jgi:transcriptional regulator with XRE-family HTH domain
VTQKQLAARARTSQAAISRIERDEISPGVETLRNLLDLLGEELRLEAEPIDYGFDTTLYDVTLQLEPAMRLAAGARAARSASAVRHARRL